MIYPHACSSYQAPAIKSIHAIKIFAVIVLKSNISGHWHIASNLVINPKTYCVVLFEIPLLIKWLPSWLLVARIHGDSTNHFLKPYTWGSSLSFLIQFYSGQLNRLLLIWRYYKGWCRVQVSVARACISRVC